MSDPSILSEDQKATMGFAGLASLISVLPKPSTARPKPATPRPYGAPWTSETSPSTSEPPNHDRPTPAIPVLSPQIREDPIWVRRPAAFWLTIVGIGGFIYLASTVSNSPTYKPRSSYTPSPAYTPPPQQAYISSSQQPYIPPPVSLTLTEVRPAGGANSVHSASEIFYCLSESVRLDSMRGILDDTSQRQIKNFNARVNDFNALCASYRYRNSDMDRAKATVDSKRSLLQTEAAGIVERWR